MYVIWNLTNACPWSCSFCCMSARNEDGQVPVKNLDFSQKIKILKILQKREVEIDFSGGDPLANKEDFSLIEIATGMMRRKLLCVSTTGGNLSEAKLKLLKKVGKVEVSIDGLPGENNPFRPPNFSAAAIELLLALVKEEIPCSAVTTLYPVSADQGSLERLYYFLCANHVPQWDILRFYPVGRGLSLPNLRLTEEKLLRLMDFFDAIQGETKIVFQHSLQVLRGEYQCHAARESIGILPSGVVTACGWALDQNSTPLSGFRLGYLPEDSFDDILKRARGELGFGERKNYCRVLAHLNNR